MTSNAYESARLVKLGIITVLLSILGLTEVTLANQSSLPTYTPVHVSNKWERQPVILKTLQFTAVPVQPKASDQIIADTPQPATDYIQSSLVCGNKTVAVRLLRGKVSNERDAQVTLLIDDQEICTFRWWGTNPDGYGYPFPDLPDAPASINIENNAIIYRKPYKLPDNTKAVFSYTLKASVENSIIDLSWDSGLSQEKKHELPKDFYAANLWVAFANQTRQDKLFFADTLFPKADNSTLLSRDQEVRIPVKGDLRYTAAGERLNSFTIDWDNTSGTVAENLRVNNKTGQEYYGLVWRQSPSENSHRGQITIDLEETRVSINTPPPVGGIDFWKDDAIHVPSAPTRNLMPNPSFEQGLRYWTWIHGGAHYTEDAPRYKIVAADLFGTNALQLSTSQSRSAGLASFPLALESGKTYTLSFYAKAEENSSFTLALASAAKKGKFVGERFGNIFGDTHNPDAKFKITTEWQRYSRTFVADPYGVRLMLSGWNKNILLDGLQLEIGEQPSDWISAPLDGYFVTAKADNDLSFGEAINASLILTGQAGQTGVINVTVSNVFRETVYSSRHEVTLPESGRSQIELPIDNLDEGIFRVRLDYTVPDYPAYTEYHRFNIMTPLENQHTTKDVMGSLGAYGRVSRGDDLARKYMEWGYGSNSWGTSENDPMVEPLQRKYRITNYVFNYMQPARGTPAADFLKWEEVTPELEALIEDIAYNTAKKFSPDYAFSWALGNEEESRGLPGRKLYDEYFKAQHAFARGILRVNPQAIITPTNGTSGYSPLRGYDAMEGYLAAAQKQGFRYGAISVHPYWNIDKGTLSNYDLDEETARLIEQMSRYGYGKDTPIYYTEMFNMPTTRIPAWDCFEWGDSYNGGHLTYDIGNREFIHAASAARAWLIVLKYWPQVKSTNMWMSRPFLDYHLSPILMNKVANTIGNIMPWVEYQADARPAGNIRAYIYKLADNSAVAGVWCIDHEVENGYKQAPNLEVKFGQKVTFKDFMGANREAHPDPNGVTILPLSPAPLFVFAADSGALTKALQEAVCDDAATALSTVFQPLVSGDIVAIIQNLTSREQSGVLSVASLTDQREFPYSVAAQAQELFTVQQKQIDKQQIQHFAADFTLTPKQGLAVKNNWSMDYFYASSCQGQPDWDNIPTFPITNYYSKTIPQPDPAVTGDLSATYQIAWDSDNLYLRVVAEDDNFIVRPEFWQRPRAESNLYLHDGCLEVYFDTGANGRSNHNKTYDQDDYRFDFSIGKNGQSGPGQVYRLREVNWQYAGGTDMPTKTDAAREIICDFQITNTGYIYNITFPRRHIEPIKLEAGTMAGFALYLHDMDSKEDTSPPKGLNTATEKGAHCDYNPHLWPIMILDK